MDTLDHYWRTAKGESSCNSTNGEAVNERGSLDSFILGVRAAARRYQIVPESFGLFEKSYHLQGDSYTAQVTVRNCLIFDKWDVAVTDSANDEVVAMSTLYDLPLNTHVSGQTQWV